MYTGSSSAWPEQQQLAERQAGHNYNANGKPGVAPASYPHSHDGGADCRCLLSVANASNVTPFAASATAAAALPRQHPLLLQQATVPR